MREARARHNIIEEYRKASVMFPEMHSYHEGYAILKEEVDELWEEIKAHPPQSYDKIRKECTQVAAMALRFLVDLCHE